MGRLSKITRGIVQNKFEILRKIKEDEKFLMEIYSILTDEFLEIRRRAIANNALTLNSDLKNFAEELRDLAAINVNERFRNDVISLITRIETFRQEYTRAAPYPSISLENRIGSLTRFILNSMKMTIMRDLAEGHARLKRLEYEFEEAA